MLNEGNIFLEGLRWEEGEKIHLIETDQTVLFFERVAHAQREGQNVEGKFGVRWLDELSPEPFGRFLSYLQVILSRMYLNPPDIGAYLGSDMPPLILRES